MRYSQSLRGSPSIFLFYPVNWSTPAKQMDGRVWGQLSTEKFWWFYNFRNTCAAYYNALWIFTEYQRLLHSPQGLSFPLVLWSPNGSFVQWSVNYKRKNYMQWWCGGKQWEKEDFLFSFRKQLQKWRALASVSP